MAKKTQTTTTNPDAALFDLIERLAAIRREIRDLNGKISRYHRRYPHSHARLRSKKVDGDVVRWFTPTSGSHSRLREYNWMHDSINSDITLLQEEIIRMPVPKTLHGFRAWLRVIKAVDPDYSDSWPLIALKLGVAAARLGVDASVCVDVLAKRWRDGLPATPDQATTFVAMAQTFGIAT